MGCCLGTTAGNHRPPPKPTAASKSPPPPFEEETVVKEVLSETPIVQKPQTPLHNNNNNVTTNNIIIHPKNANDVVEFNENENLTVTEELTENVSEISEMYSYSESFSAATTATTMTTAADTKRDEIEIDGEDEVTQKLKPKSPPAKKLVRKRPMANSGEFPARKERGARPPARRHVAPSPENKRQSPARTATSTPRGRNVAPAGRRSRSPAVRGDTCQRRKVREDSPVKKPGEGLAVEKSTAEKSGDGGDDVAAVPEVAAASETLENPLVSLECFIFL